MSKIVIGDRVSDLTKLDSHRAGDPVDQFREAIAQAGLLAPESIVLDGKIHRFRSDVTHKSKSGWYIGFGDGIVAGSFGCWRQGIESTFCAKIDRKLTAQEYAENQRRLAIARRARDEARERDKEFGAATALSVWEAAGEANADHPYLQRKGIQAHGAKVTGDGKLALPLYNVEGELCSIQYIDADGQKLFHRHGEARGACWLLGSIHASGPIYIAEGFASAATVHEYTGHPTIVAYSAANIVNVARSTRERVGKTREIVIVADNDAINAQGYRTGQRYAEQAARDYGCRCVIPPHEGTDINDFRQSGGDLSELLDPPDDKWLISADEFCREPEPIRWLVKGWIQRGALHVIHGAPGSGKTFVTLHAAMTMATGGGNWFGQRVKPARVACLVGEGHQGLKARIALWRQHHDRAGDCNMWVSKAGVALDTPQGYQFAATSLRQISSPLDVIIIDTLHRHFEGNENSAQDAARLLSACSAFQQEFGCAVILVHHPGNDEAAQQRMRGSSAFRGAIDHEISVRNPKNGKPIEISQLKAKDSEPQSPKYCTLEQYEVSGWYEESDEDGVTPVQITSCVCVEASAPTTATYVSDIEHYKRTLHGAWICSGMTLNDARMPTVSTAAIVEYLVGFGGQKRSAAMAHISPSNIKGLVGTLFAAQIVRVINNGSAISVIDGAFAASLLLSKGRSDRAVGID